MKEIRDVINHAKLTKTQKTIAEYVLDHSSDACFMTSTEIAETLHVSESSVIRFSRSLGYDGFMDFQKALRKSYQDKVLSISSAITVPSERIAKQTKLDNNTEYINRHYKIATKNMETVFLNNAPDTFDEAADIIVSSKRKYIAASRGDTCLSDYFLLYLKQMLPHVVMTNTPSVSPIDHMCSITEEDCLIIFSFPRYSTTDEVTAQMAHDAGAKVIVITDKPSALLAPYATVLFTVPVDSDAFFNSFVGPQFITEVLLDSISRKAEGVEDRLKRIDKYLDKLGNY